MDIKKTILKTTLVLAFGAANIGAYAATLKTGDILTIAPGVPVYDSNANMVNVSPGSWFGIDADSNLKIANTEKTPISTAGAGALVVGTTQGAGTFDSWTWGGFSGSDKTTVPVGGSTTTGLNLSGWIWIFGGNETSLNSGAWTPLNASSLGAPTSGYADGVGLFSWDGVYGHSYQIWFTATIPQSAGCCTNTPYMLHLEGTVQAVPLPAAVWLFGSGLLGLLGITGTRNRPKCQGAATDEYISATPWAWTLAAGAPVDTNSAI